MTVSYAAASPGILGVKAIGVIFHTWVIVHVCICVEPAI